MIAVQLRARTFLSSICRARWQGLIMVATSSKSVDLMSCDKQRIAKSSASRLPGRVRFTRLTSASTKFNREGTGKSRDDLVLHV